MRIFLEYSNGCFRPAVTNMIHRPVWDRTVRILLVEDESGIAHFARQGLIEAGYAVDWARDGEEGHDFARSAEYDAMVIDILLPRVSGLDLLTRLRGRGVRTPVLLLTALDGIDDRIRGLDSGADDYLVKPFAFGELLARLRALMRRPPLQSGTVLSVDDLTMDLARREVRRGGRAVQLSHREFTLLEYLMRNAGRVLTRTQIAERVWSFDHCTESNVIDVYIGYLRRKVDRGAKRSLLRTVRGVGYRLSADGQDD